MQNLLFTQYCFSFLFKRIVQTYLVHHGYCSAAEAFALSTGQAFTEDRISIKNRQRKYRFNFITFDKSVFKSFLT